MSFSMCDVDGLHMSAAKRAHLGKEACIVMELRDQPSKALALRAVNAEDTAAWMSTCQVGGQKEAGMNKI